MNTLFTQCIQVESQSKEVKAKALSSLNAIVPIADSNSKAISLLETKANEKRQEQTLFADTASRIDASKTKSKSVFRSAEQLLNRSTADIEHRFLYAKLQAAAPENLILRSVNFVPLMAFCSVKYSSTSDQISYSSEAGSVTINNGSSTRKYKITVRCTLQSNETISNTRYPVVTRLLVNFSREYEPHTVWNGKTGFSDKGFIAIEHVYYYVTSDTSETVSNFCPQIKLYSGGNDVWFKRIISGAYGHLNEFSVEEFL